MEMKCPQSPCKKPGFKSAAAGIAICITTGSGNLPACAPVTDGQEVQVTSSVSSVTMPARVLDGIKPGAVVSAHGWGSRVFDPATGRSDVPVGVNRNVLVSSAQLDPFSGIPVLNETFVRVVLIAPG